jgi:CHASE3 domain sensor protein
MATIRTANMGEVSFTDGKSELSQEQKSIIDDPHAQIDYLEMLLAESIQVQADLNLTMTNLIIKHDSELADMVPSTDNDIGAQLMKAIVDAMDYMDRRQDENAYRTLEDAKIQHGEPYGFKEIDPLSEQALYVG